MKRIKPQRSKGLSIERKIQIVSLALVVLGLVGVAPTLYYRYRLAKSNAIPTVPIQIPQPVLTKAAITGHPVSLSIPSVKIKVPVIDGLYNQQTKQWTLTLDKAQFATITTQPNDQTGNTYIYGHYRREVFAYLHVIKPGAEAYLTTDNGYVFTYRFTASKNITPTDTSVFAYQGPPILTLQTCSGAWFQNRQQFSFDFAGVSKAT